MNLITIEHLTKSYTERLLFDDTSFSLNEGEKVGLIGINGTGKSTLLRIAAGLEEPDEGTVTRMRGLDIRFLPQNPVFRPGERVLEAVLRDNEGKDAQWDLEAQAKAMLNKLGITEHDKKLEELSGGQRKRAALASVLLSPADVLILDEPTNHLDSEMADWLEDYLKKFKGALFMVTHDRYFLDSVTNRIVELDKGKLYSYQANYEGFLKLKAERLDMAQASERKRQSILRVELAWMQRGARARSTKQKGRIQRYEALRDQKGPGQDLDVEMESISSRLGRTTVELSNLSKSYGDRKLISDFTYIFLKNDRIGIVGPNGAGKSTLMKLMVGLLKPKSGTVSLFGANIGEKKAEDLSRQISLVYQNPEEMFIKDSIRGDIAYAMEVRGIPDWQERTDALLSRFRLTGLQDRDGRLLSGGQMRRASLAIGIALDPGVLLLDEPTANLDIATRREIMAVLSDMKDIIQTAVIATHDMQLVCQWAERIVVLCGGKVVADGPGDTVFSDREVTRLVGIRPPEIFTMAQALDQRALCYTVEEFLDRFQEG